MMIIALALAQFRFFFLGFGVCFFFGGPCCCWFVSFLLCLCLCSFVCLASPRKHIPNELKQTEIFSNQERTVERREQSIHTTPATTKNTEPNK